MEETEDKDIEKETEGEEIPKEDEKIESNKEEIQEGSKEEVGKKESENSEEKKEEDPNDDQGKKENKILKRFVIWIGVAIAVLVFFIVIFNSIGDFEYEGMKFQTEKYGDLISGFQGVFYMGIITVLRIKNRGNAALGIICGPFRHFLFCYDHHRAGLGRFQRKAQAGDSGTNNQIICLDFHCCLFLPINMKPLTHGLCFS